MFCWRITKYDPHNRNKKGYPQKQEWTSCSDIGKSFNGYVLSVDDYIHIEDLYVRAVLTLMDEMVVDFFCLEGVEKNMQPCEKIFCVPEMLEVYNFLKSKEVIHKIDVPHLIRLMLREDVWCKLYHENMYVHSGYDCYLYVGTMNSCAQSITRIKRLGLYVESYVSPY